MSDVSSMLGRYWKRDEPFSVVWRCYEFKACKPYPNGINRYTEVEYVMEAYKVQVISSGTTKTLSIYDKRETNFGDDESRLKVHLDLYLALGYKKGEWPTEYTVKSSEYSFRKLCETL